MKDLIRKELLNILITMGLFVGSSFLLVRLSEKNMDFSITFVSVCLVFVFQVIFGAQGNSRVFPIATTGGLLGTFLFLIVSTIMFFMERSFYISFLGVGVLVVNTFCLKYFYFQEADKGYPHWIDVNYNKVLMKTRVSMFLEGIIIFVGMLLITLFVNF